MKSIKSNVIVTSIRSRADGSIGLSMVSPELSPSEKVLFMELHNVNCDMTLTPIDDPSEEYEIEKEVENKTQAQRIRSVLFLLWKQEGEQGDFSDYYKQTTEKWIEKLKEKLD